MNVRDPENWRLLDTGLRRAAENFAIDRALLESHQAGRSPHTLRFLRFQPSALLGFHQNVEQELNLDYIRAHGIDVQRRLTGGGAIYFAPEHLGWELFLDKAVLGTADMTAIARRICEAAAAGLRDLGVDARFRPRNDIEVDGRKVSGTGGAFDGDSILYQGTVLVEFDVERMLRVLRIPAEKLSDKAIASARERVVSLKDLLGTAPDLDRVKRVLQRAFSAAFGAEFETAGELNAAERDLYREALTEIDSDEWIYQRNRPVTESPMKEALHRCPGGTLRAGVQFDEARGRLSQLWITGDFFLAPQRILVDLEGALRNTALGDLDRNVERFFAEHPVQSVMLEPGDFVDAIRAAVGAPAESDNG
jgi:lipoate-protein ligase A